MAKTGALALAAACLLLVTGLPAQAPAVETPAEPRTHIPAISSLINDISLESLYTYTYDLQNFTTRYAYSTNISGAYQYIFQEFASFGLQASYQNFTYGGFPMSNIIGVHPGLDPTNRTLYVVGGHMDSTSPDPMNNAPGADDNGSGTAAVLELARVMSRYRFNATLLFIAFTAEELGLVGSDYCARCYAGEGRDAGLYVNLDMIAYDPSNVSALDVITDAPGTLSTAAADEVISLISDYSIGLVPTKVYDTTANSDHASFWANGYPAIFLAEGTFNFPNWHQVTDTIEKLNFPFATNVTMAAGALLARQAGIFGPGPAGFILDRTAYRPDATVGVGLLDTDLNTDPLAADSVTRLVYSGRDNTGEWITLTESGVNTSHFLGTAVLADTVAMPSDGIVSVYDGDTVCSIHVDTPYPTQIPCAPVDGTPPAILNVAVLPGITNATVAWETDEPAQSWVDYGTAAPFGSRSGMDTLTASHSVTLENLLPDTAYLFDVVAVDAANNTLVDDRGGAHYGFHTLTGQVYLPPSNRIGFVRNVDAVGNWFGDERMLSGYSAATGRIYVGAGQFDTTAGPIPATATVTSATLDLYQQSWIYVGAGAWYVRYLNQSVDAGWTGHNYATITGAAADFQFPPTLTDADLPTREWRPHRVDPASFDNVLYRVNTGAVSFRIDGPTGPTASLFNWATGYPLPCPGVAEQRPRFSVTYSPTGDVTGPEVTGLTATRNPTMTDGRTLVTATVSDAGFGDTPIANAEFWIGADPGPGQGTPISAQDGTFDAVTEPAVFDFDVTWLPNASYLIGVRGRDRAGNWGASSTTILYVGVWDLYYPEVLSSVNPALGNVGATVTITANVTDDIGVDQVGLNVTRPDSTTAFNVSMPKPGNDWVHAAPYFDPGQWAYIVWASDASGKWNWSQGTFRIEDNLPPNIGPPVATPNPGEYPATVNVTATITDDTEVAGAAINVTRPDGQWLLNYTMDRNGDEFSYERLYTSLGTYPFVLWAMDIYGNWANRSGSFLVRDTTQPAILNDTADPDPAEVFSVVTVSAEVSDAFLTNLTLRITRPDTTWFEVLLGWNASSDRWYYPAAYDLTGTYTYRFQARDTSNNTATKSGTFLVRDTTPPDLDAVADPQTQANGGVVQIRAQAWDRYALAGVDVTITEPDGDALPSEPMIPIGGDIYVFNVTLDLLGNYSFEVTAWDTSGNGDWVDGWFLSFDGVIPSIDDLILDPITAELGTSTYFGVEASDNIAVVGVTIQVFNSVGAEVGNFSTTYNATSSLWELFRAFGPGTYTFRIWASDAAGNLAYADQSFAVGSGAPPEADAGPDQEVRTNREITLDGGGSTDDVGIVRWRWEIEGPEDTRTLNNESAQFTPSEPGTYTATLTVWDAAGRSDTDTARITVEAPDTGTTGGQPFDWWWLVLLLVLALLIAIVLIALASRRKSKQEEEAARERQRQARQPPQYPPPPPPSPPPAQDWDIPPPPP